MRLIVPAGAARSVLAGAGLLLACSVQAQSTAPTQTANPQSLQDVQQRVDRFYDQQRAPATVPADPLQAPAPEAPAPAPAGDVRVTLREVRFGPSAFLDEATLQGIAAPYAGREVGAAELNAMLDAINAAYSARGITTARAVLGGQAIQDGVLRVELIEGRLGALAVQGNARTDERFVRSRLAQREGEVVDAGALRRDLVYLNRTTDLRAQALLRAGAERGTTDILLQLTEPVPRWVDVFVDNAGVDSTGRERVGAQAQFNGLFGASDRLAASFAYAQGGLEGQASYSRIIARRNARLGASYARSQINIINGAFRDLDIEGRSQSYGIDVVQPFKATPTWLVNGLATVSRSDSQTSVAGERIADITSTVASLGISAAHLAPGREWAITQLVSSIDADQPIDGSDRFTIAVGNLGVLQRFGESRWAVRAAAGWQWSADDAVPPSNLFQVGGLGSVRGYERGVLSAPRGYFVNLELHRALGEQWDAYAFADHGSIRGDLPDDAMDGITGVGVGVNWQRRWLSASLAVGHALDQVINDQDDTRLDMRITARWQ